MAGGFSIKEDNITKFKNFINKSLENGLTVYNFHPKIRGAKQYLYPSKGVGVLQHQLAWINNIITYAKDCVFTWNTENYLDLPYVKFPKYKKNKFAGSLNTRA